MLYQKIKVLNLTIFIKTNDNRNILYKVFKIGALELYKNLKQNAQS